MQGRESAPLWREAEAACQAGKFQEAAAVLVRQMARTNPPLAAAGAVLIVKRRGWGFSKMDKPGALALAKAIEEGAWLDKWQTARAETLADRYATQCMTACWNRGGEAASKRLRLLFEGRNPFTGAALRWGATAGAREALEVKERASPWAPAAGPADSDDDDDAGESDGDDDFIAPEDEGSESEGDGSESEEGEEPSASDSETEDDAPSEPEDDEAAHAPAAPATVLASQAARDALLARRDALQEALQGANAAALQAKAHADALRGSLSALDRQLAVVERRVAHDTAQQAPPAASPADARRSGAPHSGRLRRKSAPKPAKAPQPETPAGDESESELPPLPAGVVSRKRPAAARADDLEDDVTDDDKRPRAAASRRRRLTYAASDGGDLDDDDDDAA